ncbi:MAG: ATP-binding protein [Bacteroidota bacterium]
MSSFNSSFKPVFLGILFLVSFGTSVIAQHYPVRTYTEVDGLANSMIYDLKQDSSGIIWIARRSGISSYDGISFTNYNVADGLSPTSYAFLFLDSRNTLWALVESGSLVVSEFKERKWINYTCPIVPSRTSFNAFTAFLVVNEPNKTRLFVGTAEDGLLIYADKQWKKLGAKEGLPGVTITSLAQFEGKTIVGTDNGLAVLENNSFSTRLAPVSPYLSKPVLAMIPEGDLLWIVGDKWLGTLINGKFTLVTTDFFIPTERNGRRTFIQPDHAGRIYFGNLFRVYCYDIKNNAIQLLTRKNGLISEGGSSVLVDREQNTWVAGFRGITRMLSRRFTSFSSADGLFSNEVASAIEYKPGQYVFGHDGVLSYYNGKSFSTFLLDRSLANASNESRILDITKDTSGSIWAAVTTNGLAKIDKNRKVTWFRAAQGLNGYIFSVLSTPNGKLYAGGSDGFYEYINGRFIRRFSTETHGSPVRKIYLGQDNSVYFSSINWGIFGISHGKVIRFYSPDNQLANNVFAFLEDSKKRKWVGTTAGLYIVSDTLLVRSVKPLPSINRPIYSILEDNNGRLWFGSDNGIYLWDGVSLDHFSTSDGVSGLEINRSACFIDYRNRIWFGTNNGLTVFDPEMDYSPTSIPPPILKLQYVEAGSDSIGLENYLELPFDVDNLTFHFRAISFIEETKVIYRYKLEGLDTAWSRDVFYQNNSVKFNNLKPGTYRFYVKARNALGVWTEPLCSPLIKINQPFWFRWWFMVFALMAMGIVGVLTGRYVLITRYNVRLEDMVSERTKDLERSEERLKESNAAKDNFFSIIAHDLRSPFNVILGMLDLLTREYSEYTDEERQQMLMRLKNASTRTIDLLENLLTWARAQRGLLPYSPVCFDVIKIIQENILLFESAAHSKDIMVKLCGEKSLLVTADHNMINTIVRNLISNAIKFTILGGTIIITAENQQDGDILVSVKDSGIGMSETTLGNLFKIEKRTVMRGTNNEMGTGLGLILSKDFIERNKGKIWVISEEDVGSTFYFTLPLTGSA